LAENSRKYLDPQNLAKLRGLRLRARTVVEGYIAGMHRSPYHGFSVEFAQHREYAPGDDLRYVDWKVYGRTDKFYLKQFEEETNQICYLLLDISASMGYQGPAAPMSKLEFAKCVVASLAYLVLQQQDAVCMATFDSQARSFLRAAGHLAQLENLLSELENACGKEKTALGPALHELAERLGKRGIVLVVSDFFDQLDSVLWGLRHLRHRRHDVIAVQVLDPAELEFPFHQLAMFRGVEEEIRVVADPRAVRRAYLAGVNKFLRELKAGCRAHGIDYLQMRTDRPLGLALANYLAHRARFSR